MKKWIAVLLAAVSLVSFCACGDQNKKENSGGNGSVAESAEESALPEVDVDPDLQKEIEEKFDMEKLGPLTKYAVQMLEGKNLTLDMSVEQIKEKSSKKEESSKKSESSASVSVDFSSLTSDVNISITKNGNDDMRLNFGMGMFSFDLLKNKDGLFSVNTRKKTYQVLQTAEQLKKLEEDASKDSSAQASKAFDNVKNATGDLLKDVSLDDLLNSQGKADVTFKGDGEAEYKNRDYYYESYSVTAKVVTASGDTSKESDPVTTEVTCYFNDEKILKIMHLESDKGKFDLIFNDFSNEIDEDELVLPSNYTEKEASKIDLSEFSIPELSGVDLSKLTEEIQKSEESEKSAKTA